MQYNRQADDGNMKGRDGEQGVEQEGGHEGERVSHHGRLRQHAQQGEAKKIDET